jgi:phosphoglycolate phosphatase
MLSGVKLIIWDWNGTLLNDVSVCVEAMNEMLSERNLTILNDSTYRNVFTFPVKNYYQKLGFDFDQEPFEIPAMQFMDLYRKKNHRSRFTGRFHSVNETVSIIWFSSGNLVRHGKGIITRTSGSFPNPTFF